MASELRGVTAWGGAKGICLLFPRNSCITKFVLVKVVTDDFAYRKMF